MTLRHQYFSIIRQWNCHISNYDASESEIMKIKTIKSYDIQYAEIFNIKRQKKYSESLLRLILM